MTYRSHTNPNEFGSSLLSKTDESSTNYTDEEKCKLQLLKLVDQLHASLDRELYETFRKELADYIKQQIKLGYKNIVIIDAKEKRLHQRRKATEFRGSVYRGVSKNKFKWQMMIMINQKKVYLGAIRSE